MKRTLLAILLVLACALPAIAQENEDTAADKEEFTVSVLDEKLLMAVPAYFSNASYQNPAGQTFRHKEVTQMLLAVPECETYVKQYRGWTAATVALLGLFCAGIATHTVYTLNEDLPQSDTVKIASVWASSLSLAGALLTSSVAGSKYRVAVDTYNLSVIKGN